MVHMQELSQSLELHSRLVKEHKYKWYHTLLSGRNGTRSGGGAVEERTAAFKQKFHRPLTLLCLAEECFQNTVLIPVSSSADRFLAGTGSEGGAIRRGHARRAVGLSLVLTCK
jgi:hypothetical protein